MIKTIIISAGASRQSGAKTIYIQLMEHLRNHVGNHRYIVFVDERMPKPEITGVEYVIVDVRKGLDRLRFDYEGCRKILGRMNVKPDLIISLQNTGVACLKDTWQLIYYHQPLPFYPQRWNPLKGTERRMFMYKHIYPWFVKDSIRRDRVDFVAQIPFIKNGIVRQFGIVPERVHVFFPDTERVEAERLKPYAFEENTYNFVYPATNMKYKNHVQIVRALKELSGMSKSICDKVRVHLTLKSGENIEIERMITDAGLQNQIVMHGAIDHQQLIEMLNSSHGLLFPSTIETLGLPLLEAAKLGKAIVAADLTYAHQVMGSYEGVSFADAYSADEWSKKILALCVENPLKYNAMSEPEESSWSEFFRLVDNRVGGGRFSLEFRGQFETRVLRIASDRRVAA